MPLGPDALTTENHQGMLKFHSLKVARLIPDTAQAVRLVFQVPEALRQDYAYTQGQHLNLEVQYSPSTAQTS